MKLKAVLPVVLAVGALLAVGQDKAPDLTGKWKLDTAKSDFGMLPPIESQTNTIDYKDPKLKIATTVKGAQGERSFESNYTTDGKENTNQQGPRDIKTTASWAGKKLVMNS